MMSLQGVLRRSSDRWVTLRNNASILKAIRRNNITTNVHRLVYYEVHDNPTTAIKREKSIKKWRRDWKIKLIEKDNPGWDDLYADL